MWDVIGGRRIFLCALAFWAAGLVGGCGSMPFSQLPDVAKLPEKVLSKDEQQSKMNEMIAKGQSHQSDAAKEIEKGK